MKIVIGAFGVIAFIAIVVFACWLPPVDGPDRIKWEREHGKYRDKTTDS